MSEAQMMVIQAPREDSFKRDFKGGSNVTMDHKEKEDKKIEEKVEEKETKEVEKIEEKEKETKRVDTGEDRSDEEDDLDEGTEKKKEIGEQTTVIQAPNQTKEKSLSDENSSDSNASLLPIRAVSVESGHPVDKGNSNENHGSDSDQPPHQENGSGGSKEGSTSVKELELQAQPMVEMKETNSNSERRIIYVPSRERKIPISLQNWDIKIHVCSNESQLKKLLSSNNSYEGKLLYIIDEADAIEKLYYSKAISKNKKRIQQLSNIADFPISPTSQYYMIVKGDEKPVVNDSENIKNNDIKSALPDKITDAELKRTDPLYDFTLDDDNVESIIKILKDKSEEFFA